MVVDPAEDWEQLVSTSLEIFINKFILFNLNVVTDQDPDCLKSCSIFAECVAHAMKQVSKNFKMAAKELHIQLYFCDGTTQKLWTVL